jgi:hypothetical protein
MMPMMIMVVDLRAKIDGCASHHHQWRGNESSRSQMALESYWNRVIWTLLSGSSPTNTRGEAPFETLHFGAVMQTLLQ